MASTVNYFSFLPKFIKEGIAELTHGIDDERGSSIFKIAYDATELDAGIDLSNTGTGSQAVGDGYAGGFMFLRYFARQAALQTLNLPAFNDITVDVDFNNLNVAAGNILYIDTRQANPVVQIAQDEEAFIALPDQDFIFNLGTVFFDETDKFFYYAVANDLFKQNITAGGQISHVIGLNALTDFTGSDDSDILQIS